MLLTELTKIIRVLLAAYQPLASQDDHDIIHRVAAILAMEPDDGDGGGDEPLAEVAWDGTLDGETIELQDDEEE